MSISILAGVAKGLTLATPHSDLTRPTSVLLKRRIFDANQDLSGVIFIDLCAGVGTVGLEALSRGADQVHLIERDSRTFKQLQHNLSAVIQRNPAGEGQAYRMEVESWIKQKTQWLTDLDQAIIYLDPPYEDVDTYTKVLQLLAEIGFRGQVWSEACRQKTMHEDQFISRYYGDKVYRQGTSYIVVGTLKVA